MAENDKKLEDTLSSNKHEKGVNMYERRSPVNEYGQVKVGVKTLDDAIVSLDTKCRNKYGYNKNDEHLFRLYDKQYVLRAIARGNPKELRKISEFFYRTNGIYQNMVDFYGTMYRHDWYIVPAIYNKKYRENEKNIETLTDDFFEILDYMDGTHIAKITNDISLDVVKYGLMYYLIVEGKDGILFQELPIDYCRSRYKVNNIPVVEFDMSYFDENFKDINYRLKVISMFPKDIQRGYILYKENKLQPDFLGDKGSWYALEPGSALEFSLKTGNKLPMFINVIPDLMDLDAAQELDKRKQMQELVKIIVQKLPITTKGDLVFDVEEGIDIHNNTVEMLKHTMGTDVITSFADVSSIDLSDSTKTDTDGLERVERTVFNSGGIPSNVFNPDGNLALSTAILHCEGIMRDLKMQFEIIFNEITKKRTKKAKAYSFNFFMMDTTQYNYERLSKLYKEQMTLGYGKLFSQIALGHSQNALMSTAFFENDVLNLAEVLVPPMQSSSTGSDDITALKSSRKAGRPEKDSTELSDKTIANKEAMN